MPSYDVDPQTGVGVDHMTGIHKWADLSLLLNRFMSAGGWDLTYTWLSDGVVAKNWPLVTELVELLLICPVDIERLKTNACPKLIKTLSKDTTADETVRLLACKLVEQWLRVVRGDNDPTQPATTTTVAPVSNQLDTDSTVQQDNCCDPSEGHLPVKIKIVRDGEKMSAKISGRRSSTEAVEEECNTPTSSDDVNIEEEPTDVDINEDDDDDDEDYEEIKPVKLKKKPPSKVARQAKKPAKVSGLAKKERDSTDSMSSGSSKSNKPKEIAKSKKENNESPKVKPTLKNKTSSPKTAKESVENEVTKKSDEFLKNKAKLSLSLKTKKIVSNKDKKDIKSEKNESKEQNVLDNDDSLTEKEKESLKKLIAPPISKLGKIPKKTSNKEEKQSEEKNRTLKEENSDIKSDVKKSYDVKKPEVKRQEKNFSIGVDRKAVDKGEKPKTVKTYNSKFRSTGLEEEVKPPPPRPVHKKPPTPSFPPTLGEKKLSKRTSPPPEPHIPEKKLKPESPLDEKKPQEKAGGIKLIPPKPKRSADILQSICGDSFHYLTQLSLLYNKLNFISTIFEMILFFKFYLSGVIIRAFWKIRYCSSSYQDPVESSSSRI